jgi:IS5 family transposase
VQLAGKIDWEWIDGEISPLYSDKGRPGIATRFVIGLLLLKHIYGLSDEGVCERWVHDPYFQYFTGEEFFQHEFPHERSDISHWRKRLGDKLELLLAESLRIAHQSGALRTKDLEQITVDTTVQPKAITFPTDAKLLHAAIKGLNRLARKHAVQLRQSYLRIAKQAAMMAGRYAHALGARSSAPMSTKDTAATMRQTHTASSSPGRSATCSVPLSASCGAAPPSSP